MTVHGPVPEHAPPDHPVKIDPTLGVEVNVTGVPWTYVSEQRGPQLMPAGELVTVPVPVPGLVTERVL